MTDPLVQRVRDAYTRIADVGRPEVWIDLRPQADVEAEARSLDPVLPLAGQLLAVKGNIDVAGLPTTAGCPSYAYRPAEDAPVVARLRAAGALVLGTTNLDQFATGLVGTRSPYGAVHAAGDPLRVAGGSSSGSAVAVALGIADLALGTDTAGSGRVPAAFNGIVGLKATRGAVPTEGVVPACASLDCVTVFARTPAEAERAMRVMASSPKPTAHTPPRSPGPYRIGVPPLEQLGEMDPGWAEAYEATVARFHGAEIVPVDLTPFLEAGALLYQGAFVAERYDAVGAFLDKHTGAADLDPTVAAIITSAASIPAHRLAADQQRLARLKEQAALRDLDALLLPTTPGHPTLAEVAADPVGANTRLGRFTNCANLLDLCAIAFPGVKVDGRPFGVMLLGEAHTEERLSAVARLFTPAVRLAVVGAHLSGQPLNHQLRSLGARLVRTTRTAASYRLYALDTSPAKPGLVRMENGSSVEAEVWELSAEALGRLTAALPRPMTLGSVDLADGTAVTGFLCEPAAVHGARDITEYGGWRAYLDG